MAWIEIHQTLPTHRKTQTAADLLQISPVHLMGHLIAFWLWALDNTPDGDISHIPAKQIARAGHFEGAPDTFFDALLTAGFVSRYGEKTTIHDWHDYAGKLISRRTADRDRQRERRKPHPNKASAGHPTDNRKTSFGTVPYSTVHKDYPPIVPPQGDESNEDSTLGDAAFGESLLVEKATGEPKQVSHSKTQKRRKTELSSAQQRLFDAFWEPWPHKVSKGQAETTWGKLNPDAELAAKIVAGVERARRHDRRFAPGGFMPHASTWLNDKGWEDVHTSAPARDYNGRMGAHRLGTSTGMYDESEIVLRRIAKAVNYDE